MADPIPRRTWIGLGLSQLLFVGVLAPLVYYETFTIFRAYDDEGFLMLAVKHFIDGHRLYDEVCTLYGPVYFAYKWLLHGIGGLPITHDVVRLTACVMRLAIGVVASLATFGLTRGVPLAAAAQVLVTTYLTAIRNEPGHPQELAGLLAMAIVAVPALVRESRPRALIVALGAAIAALTMIKTNLGVFAGIAVWMALLGAVRGNKLVVALRIASGALVVALPWLFMRAHLGVFMTYDLAATESAGLFALAVISLTRSHGLRPSADLSWYAAAFVAVGCLIVLATMLTGTTLQALLDCVILTPLRMPGLFYVAFFVWPPTLAPIAAVAALATRIAATKLPEFLVVCAKLAFGLYTCLAMWRGDVTALASATTIFLWLVVVAPVAGRHTVPDLFARLVLCWMTAVGLLQAYPVGGSQVWFGTVTHVLCGMVCLGDAVRWLRSFAGSVFGPRLRAVTAAALVAALVADCVRADLGSKRQYLAFQPLALPGAERIRLFRPEAEVYRALAAYVREHADTLFSSPGFSSLYFWTGTVPPTLDVIGHDMRFYSPERQAAMISGMLSARHPLIVRFHGMGTPHKAFLDRIDRGFVEVESFGPYKVLARRSGAEHGRLSKH